MATELELSQRDRDCIAATALGQKQALVTAVRRFHPVVLALLAHRLKDFDAARRVTDDVVRGIFGSLLTGSLTPGDFASDLNRRVAAAAEMTRAADTTVCEPLHTMHGAAKLVRRRAAAQAIRELPLDQFMAIVLHYHADWAPAEMIGIVASTQKEVEQSLAAAHAAIVQASPAGE